MFDRYPIVSFASASERAQYPHATAIMLPSRRGSITTDYCHEYRIRTSCLRNTSPCTVCQRAHILPSSQRSLRASRAIHSFPSSETILTFPTLLGHPVFPHSRNAINIIIHGCRCSLQCLLHFTPFRVLVRGDETHVGDLLRALSSLS